MVTKFDSIKVTLWSSIEDEANEILKCIKKTVLCNYIYQDLTVDTSYFYKSIFSDLAIESITCQIDQHIGKQIHILMYEEITYESEENILLRLKRLFYFASLCINPDICVIICGYPNNFPKIFHYRTIIHDLYNFYCELLIEKSGVNNIHYFDTNFLLSDRSNLTFYRKLTNKGCNNFVKQLKIKLNFAAFNMKSTMYRSVYLSYCHLNVLYPLREKNLKVPIGEITNLQENFELGFKEARYLLIEDYECSLPDEYRGRRRT